MRSLATIGAFVLAVLRPSYTRTGYWPLSLSAATQCFVALQRCKKRRLLQPSSRQSSGTRCVRFWKRVSALRMHFTPLSHISQWYFNVEQGRAALENEENRHDVIRLLWEQWAPTWSYSADDFARSAPSFDNPDFVEVVLHSYRHRNFHPDAPGEERFLEVERRLADLPPVPVPTIVLHGRDTGLVKPSEDPARDQARFPAMVARRLVHGAGHDLPVQRPEAVSGALIELLAGKGLELP